MNLTRHQLKQAYLSLNNGTVCLDDHLAQGVLVYVEGLMISEGIERDCYLSLDTLTKVSAKVRMGSVMPIDFFGLKDTSCDEGNFKPISLKVCELVSLPDGQTGRRWKTLANFAESDIAVAMEILLLVISELSELDDYSAGECVPAGLLAQFNDSRSQHFGTLCYA
ncbi:hypothetical protein [Photobacterium lutimaris]|uniref:Uncharacterized protein n=1 Tax=Photobacterium lutimaris TaxID=388278 RepID=A0A2T3J160_9GAMM|nr:hypothetical protein [Photobacterium lutimaris]PSU34808.1 hypothetical protein C9I99_06870 [Photobacterium lutimaris]TDR77138.1 hypothetical protein DFP78_102145 [Photobacterium lutimaris]